MIPELRDLSYDEGLIECYLTRRLRGDKIEVCRIQNGHENIERNIFPHSRKIIKLQDNK